LPTIHAHISNVEITRGRKTASQYSRDLKEFTDGCTRRIFTEHS
jgi:hypothetical protein